MKNNFPKKLKIFSKVFKVKYIKDFAKVDKDRQSLLFGQVDFDTNTIRVFYNKSRQVADVWHTLFHEILHILKVNFDITLNEENEESIIDNLALGLMTTCLTNKLSFRK